MTVTCQSKLLEQTEEHGIAKGHCAVHSKRKPKEDLNCLLFGMNYLQDYAAGCTWLQQAVFLEEPVETHSAWDILEGKSHVAGIRTLCNLFLSSHL